MDCGPSGQARVRPLAALAEDSRLADELIAGRFILTSSVGTLGEPDQFQLRRKLRDLRSGFGFVKFGDNPRSRARVSPWAAAAVALSEGLEPIVHVGCRDRNRLALKADLLGGRLLGVTDVLCLRGDEMAVSDQRDVMEVRDLDVVELIRLANEPQLGYVALAACDPNAGAGGDHWARLLMKVQAGARLLETQPVFDVSRFAQWLEQLHHAGIQVPVLVDVSVAVTPRDADLLERIPFVEPPADLAGRIGRDPRAGIEIAAAVVAALRHMPGVAGCHVEPVGGDPDVALAVLDTGA